jgi:hypothetical protein
MPRYAGKKTAVGTVHVIDVDDQADAADGRSARSLCGWVPDSLWSRRRAAEAAAGINARREVLRRRLGAPA